MKLTREGKRFLLATCLIALAAFNTGNNLIYLILAMMLSILTIAVAALVMNLRGLTIHAAVKRPVFAGQGAEMSVTAANRKFLPSYSLQLVPPEGISGEGRLDFVPASSSAECRFQVRFEKRGAYSFGDILVESGFPFIFLSKRVRAAAVGDVTVYPSVVGVGGIGSIGGSGRSLYSLRSGRGDDLLSIREYRHGDDTKHISWKASARAQSLMVREFAETLSGTVTVYLDDGPPFDPAAFERAVSCAASVSMRLIEEGYLVRLATAGKVVPFGGGPEHVYKILDVLAVAREAAGEDAPRRLEGQGASVVVLKSGASALGSVITDPELVIDASRV